MRAAMRAWAAYFRCRGYDGRLPTLVRYGAIVLAEQAEEGLRDADELIRRLRRGA